MVSCRCIEKREMVIRKQFNYPIAWAKAICIILMVVGHSGCPSYLRNMIYLFHVPLFFVCSGYFFRVPIDYDGVLCIIRKRINGLWLPFVKWSLLFLLLNNLFVAWHLLDANSQTSIMSVTDMIHAALRILMMGNAPILVAGFWFLRVLFVSIVVTAFFSYKKIIRPVYIVVFSFLFSFALQIIPCLPISSHSLSIFLMGIGFHGVGMWYKEVENTFVPSWKSPLALFIIMLALPLVFHAEMIGFDKNTIAPFFITASILSVLYINTLNYLHTSNYVGDRVNRFLVFVSSNTLQILALHFLCFKLVTYFIIVVKELPINCLASFPVLYKNSGAWWILYSCVGVLLPLVFCIVRNRIKALVFLPGR